MKDKMYLAILSTFDARNWRSAAAITLLSCAVVTAVQPVLAADAAISPVEGVSGQAVMNFVGADIESVIKAVGQYTNMTFIIDPRVKGTINLVSEKPLSKAQAFDLLASTLRLQGYAVVRGDGFVKVVPEADAKLQLGAISGGARAPGVRGDQIATQIFSLNYESATNILPVLRPLISPNNTINANPGNNTLVVTDYAENLQRLGKMIAALDVPAISDLDVIPVRYAVASDIAVMASKLLDSGSAAPGAGDGSRTIVMADSRTNSVIVRAPSAGRANLAKSLIAKLDQPTTNAGNVHVVYLKNADAVKLAKTLRAIVSADTSLPTSNSSSKGAASTSGNSGSMLQSSNTNSPGTSGTTPSATGDASSQSTGGGSSGAGFIQADDTTNTLIITASEPVYRNIRGVIDQLDTRRAQVYVEALIVEVTDTAASEIGVQWLALTGDSNSNYRVGGGTGFTGTNSGITSGNLFNTAIGQAINSGTSTTTVPTLGSGLQLGVFRQIAGKIGLGALASALNNTTGGNVLSMPNLLTLDNEEAKIIVGQNVPFVTGSYATTGGTTTNPFTTVDRKDVGTALKIKPHISEGGTVRLEISQEVSAVIQSTASNQNGPTTTKRSLDTNVLVDDGQIIALGGLIGDDNESSIQKVPLLGDLPFIGNFFKYQSGSRSKTNLMIFLRPTIIRDKEQSNLVAVDRYDYMRKQQITVQPGKSILTDFGPSVMAKPEDGGPFLDLRKQGAAADASAPDQATPAGPVLVMPKPAAASPAPGFLNDRTP
ncbi:type II secretion system secretin GspD [Collimonas sp. NPDC087041]|uniref:type II secretion system secretin GspD n=1 Tax=Collimonas sp. NPDC087041 TaxID=3363960 RepID=UPI00381EE505